MQRTTYIIWFITDKLFSFFGYWYNFISYIVFQ